LQVGFMRVFWKRTAFYFPTLKRTNALGGAEEEGV